MSDDKHEPGKDGLPLPSPRSPEALDRRILAHARDNAPERSGPLQHPWMTGLATACLVAVAVFISEPDQEAPVFAPVPAESSRPADEERAKPLAGAAPGPAAAKLGRLQADAPAREEAAGAAAESSAMAEQAFRTSTDADLADQREVLPERALREQLAHCARLLDNGDTERARALYLQLRENCGDCDLPETLEEALQRYPPDH